MTADTAGDGWHGPVTTYGGWLTRDRLIVISAVFAGYAGVLAVYTGGADEVWAAWAALAYGLATIISMLVRRSLWPALLVSASGALCAPLAWLITQVPPTPEVDVISRSAVLLLRHGTPYLASGQLDNWLSYNPYLPAMALFGMPRALGLAGPAGDPRVWMTLVSVAGIAAALWFAAPRGHRRDHAGRMAVGTVFAVSSPIIAFPLAVGITDPPIIALLLVTLALAAHPGTRLTLAGVMLGVASAVKATAWPAIPVLAAFAAARDSFRAMWRFLAATVLIAVATAVTLAPAALAKPTAFVSNTLLFPLGLSKHQTPAASPLPGHLLAMTGAAGHLAATVLLLLAGLAFAASLLIRPPDTIRATVLRLALGLAVMFTLAPATRWGYFVYPIGLAGWLLLTGPDGKPQAMPATAPSRTPVPSGAQS